MNPECGVVSTEIGEFPDYWSVQRFDSLFSVQQGKQVSKNNRIGENQRSFLRTRNLFWGRLDLSDLDEMHFTEADENRLALQPGDLLVCEGGDIGRTAIWRGDIPSCYYQNHLHRARLKNPAMADPAFVLYWLWYAFEIGNVYFGRGNVTTIPNLSQSKLRELPLPVPPLLEQRKIAVVLGTAQRAIEEQERLLQLTTELKTSLLHKLFTEGLRGEPQKMTEIGPIPESWKIARLADLFQIKHGYAFDGAYFQDSGSYILLTPGHFFEAGGFRDQGEKTKYYVGDFPVGYLLRKYDLLVAMTEQKEGLLGSSVLVPESDRYLHNQRLGLIQELDEMRLSKEFLYHLFSTPVIRKRISMTASGSKVRHTSPNKIRDVQVALPSLEEQRQTVEILKGVDNKLVLGKRKHTALTDLFHTLLQELMTAQIRVHDQQLSNTPCQVGVE